MYYAVLNTLANQVFNLNLLPPPTSFVKKSWLCYTVTSAEISSITCARMFCLSICQSKYMESFS